MVGLNGMGGIDTRPPSKWLGTKTMFPHLTSPCRTLGTGPNSTGPVLMPLILLLNSVGVEARKGHQAPHLEDCDLPCRGGPGANMWSKRRQQISFSGHGLAVQAHSG